MYYDLNIIIRDEGIVAVTCSFKLKGYYFDSIIQIEFWNGYCNFINLHHNADWFRPLYTIYDVVLFPNNAE